MINNDKHTIDETNPRIYIWRFPKIGLPPVLIHFQIRLFPEINHPRRQPEGYPPIFRSLPGDTMSLPSGRPPCSSSAKASNSEALWDQRGFDGFDDSSSIIFQLSFQGPKLEVPTIYIYIYIYARGPRFPRSILVFIHPYVKNHCFAIAKGGFCTFFFFIL